MTNPPQESQILTPRQGTRPTTIKQAPHNQVDQLASPDDRRRLSALIVEDMLVLTGVSKGWSRRAPPGSVGFYLEREACCRDSDAFLLDNEVAHVHTEDDGSLHAILPEPLRQSAIDAGWAEPHPMAGMPTVSPRTVMIYAPRNEQEVETIVDLLRQTYKAALAR